ncbi:MAG: tetratricopeptide repeat protein [Candidatus Koribacter versatilis]|uniref:Tetratricopeptide repeat protein n=1 Tax=Candidatus Korobacter versatilis TaxID=658062 RepID=A0A932EPD2_9BACT|nr:tetratricopeptide repeat protein [Candidatus Koribacter versatilis]
MIWALADGRRAVRFIFILLLAFLLGGCASVDQRLRRAAQLEDRGDYARALAEYEDLIPRIAAKDHARLAVAYVKAGECFWRLGRPNEAVKAFERALALDPSNVDAHLRVAEVYVEQVPERALAEIRFVLALQPKNGEAFSVMGAAYSSAGELPMAKAAYQRALELEPDRASVAVALADLEYRSLNTSGARAVLHHAASASPRTALAWLALGRLEEQEGDADAAEEAYRHAVAAEDTAETNLRMAQFLQRNARIAEAEKILRRADGLRPWLPTALPDFEFQSGRVLNAMQAYNSALEPGRLPVAPGAARTQRGLLAARMIEADLNLEARDAPLLARRHLDQYRADLDPVTVLVLRAEIALAENDLGAARTQTTAAAAQAPDSEAAHYLLGVVQHRDGDVTGARSEWQRAIELAPMFVPARLALAREELAAGAPQAAEEHVAMVLREEPANLRALCLFARVLIAEKRFDSALAIARRAVAADGGAVEPRIVMGEAALARGNAGQALLDYEQAVLLDPRSHAAVDGLVRVYRAGHVTRPMLAHMEGIAWREPRSATLMEIAGRLYRDHGWTADAERCFRRVLELDRDRATAATELARAYADSGELQQAGRSLALAGGDSAALLAAFEAEQRNDVAAAIRQYEGAVHGGEKSGVAANNLAWLYAAKGMNLDRALALAQQALAMAPFDPRVLDTVGYVRLQRREYSEAVRALKKGFDLARSPLRRQANEQVVTELRSHLAEAYRRAGQPQEADALARD